jgi:molybdopterin-guanine dinucleotide biosynthesis protein A
MNRVNQGAKQDDETQRVHFICPKQLISQGHLMKQPLGVILAGGQATRMGGGDKSLLTLGTKSILRHVIDRLDPQVDGIILNANGPTTRFADYGMQVVPDSITGFAGPLSGVLAGLDHAASTGHTHIVTAAADTPFFPCDLTPMLLQAGEKSGLALAASPSGRQPTFGLWPVALREDLREALTDGLRKVVMWTNKHNAGTAEFVDDAAFFNINTPADLQAAAGML